MQITQYLQQQDESWIGIILHRSGWFERESSVVVERARLTIEIRSPKDIRAYVSDLINDNTINRQDIPVENWMNNISLYNSGYKLTIGDDGIQQGSGLKLTDSEWKTIPDEIHVKLAQSIKLLSNGKSHA
jgi:hypothetical protein